MSSASQRPPLQTWIAHLDMDCFFVAVERLNNPQLIGIPVAVGGKHQRSVVSSASYEARLFGVKSAMPTAQAYRLCPTLTMVEPHFSEYSRLSKLVFNSLRAVAPLVQQVSVDEAYLDFTGCESIYGEPAEFGRRAKAAVQEASALPCTIAIAANKLVAKVATDFAKPNGLIVIQPGTEAQFLRALPIGRLPGVGSKTLPRLEMAGVKTCGDLVDKDPTWLTDRFGDYILELQRKARGEDDRVVHEDRDAAKSISEEETFERDISDKEKFKTLLNEMAEHIAEELRSEHLAARTIQIKLRNPQFETRTRARSLPQATHRAVDIAKVAHELLELNLEKGGRLRLIGLAVRNFDSTAEGNAPAHQLSLFENPHQSQKLEKLEHIKDQLRKKFGSDTVMGLHDLQNNAVPSRANLAKPTRK